jgi:hypothetical protein
MKQRELFVFKPSIPLHHVASPQLTRASAAPHPVLSAHRHPLGGAGAHAAVGGAPSEDGAPNRGTGRDIGQRRADPLADPCLALARAGHQHGAGGDAGGVDPTRGTPFAAENRFPARSPAVPSARLAPARRRQYSPALQQSATFESFAMGGRRIQHEGVHRAPGHPARRW